MSKVSIFWVDPGTVTGIARGVFPAESDSVWEGLCAGTWESWEVGGEPARQAWEIVEEYAEWVGAPTFTKIRKQGINNDYFGIEDFVVRLGTGGSSKRELLDPVRVSSGIDTLSWSRSGTRWLFIEYQQPSVAKTYATNDRLRAHKMWVKGSEHRRDAVRHMCRRYATYLGNK